tara:strand:- start:239 stop:739 length:501 start_codon:yes stop_codon:yes gene_type:complete
MLKKKILISLAVLFLTTSNSFSNSQGYRDELPELERLTDLSIGIRRINKGLKYEAKGKTKKANKMYSEAINFLLLANKNQDIDPNLFFYLGFTYNKLNNISNAEIYYQLGLALDPNHKEINKHLGELYIASNKINLARERLDALKNCNCKQYLDLENIIVKKKNTN